MRDWAESGSRWAEFHENSAYRMFNLVRKQIILGQKAILGANILFFFLEILGHIKEPSKFQNFVLVPGVQKIDSYDFPGIFYEKNQEYGNLE